MQLLVEFEPWPDVVTDSVPRRELGIDQEQLVDRHLGAERLLAGQPLDRLPGVETQRRDERVGVTERCRV